MKRISVYGVTNTDEAIAYMVSCHESGGPPPEDEARVLAKKQVDWDEFDRRWNEIKHKYE